MVPYSFKYELLKMRWWLLAIPLRICHGKFLGVTEPTGSCLLLFLSSTCLERERARKSIGKEANRVLVYFLKSRISESTELEGSTIFLCLNLRMTYMQKWIFVNSLAKKMHVGTSMTNTHPQCMRIPTFIVDQLNCFLSSNPGTLCNQYIKCSISDSLNKKPPLKMIHII